MLKKSRAIFYAARIFFVLASGDRTFENVAKLSPVAWSKVFHTLQVIFHSSPEVGEWTCMKMWLVQIWCPLSLKLWVRWCKIGLSTVESQPTDWGSIASAPSHLSFWRKVGKEDTNEAHHSKRTVFSGSDYPLTFGDSRMGGNCLSYLELSHRTQKLIQRMAGTAVQRPSSGKGLEPHRQRCPKVASSATCFLHWVAEIKDLVCQLQLNKAVTTKITKVNNIDSTFYHQKKL